LRDVVTIPTNNVAGKANSSTNSFKPWTWSRSNCLAYPAQKPRPMTNSTGKSTENELKKVEMNIHFSFCEGISPENSMSEGTGKKPAKTYSRTTWLGELNGTARD